MTTQPEDPCGPAPRNPAMRYRLARLAERSGLPAPADHVAIRRSSIVEAAIDPLEAWIWIEAHGGSEHATYLAPSRRHLLHEPREVLQPEPYFIVPLRAFETD